MTFPRRDDKYRLWVTDTGRNEPADYEATGFTYCTKDAMSKEGWVGEGHNEEGDTLDSRVSLNVGMAGTLNNAMAYLMEIDMSEWKEIRAQIIEDKREPLKQIINKHEQDRKSKGMYGEMNIKNI
jgi:hypothetical protein